jgi:integrase
MNTSTVLQIHNDQLAEIIQLYPEKTKVINNKSNNKNNSPSTVQPLKNKEDIEKAKQYFHDTPSRYSGLNLRNYCLFILGINTGRRISDLLNLKIGDIINKKGKFKDWIEIREQKTKKLAEFQIHPYVREGILEYLNSIDSYSLDDYLFKSNKGNNSPISRVQAYRIIDDMSKALNLNVNVGTHTLRKTYAYQKIHANKNDPYIVASISSELNHRDIKTTYHYCGFDREIRSHLYMDDPV